MADGGAAAQAAALINFAKQQAQQLATVADTRVANAISLLGSALSDELLPPEAMPRAGPSRVRIPTDAKGEKTAEGLEVLVLPVFPGPQVDASAESIQQSYRSVSAGVMEQINTMFLDFFQTHFPPDTYVLEAEAWVTRAIAEGGTGLNLAVEAQLWERARSRTLADADRAQAELAVAWASRRFPVPPGAYMNASLQLARNAQDAVAEAARTQAVETFKAELENVRFAVERATQLRTLAMQSAGEYIRSMALGPQVGQGMSTVVPEAQTKLATTLREYYKTQMETVDWRYKVAMGNMEKHKDWDRAQWSKRFEDYFKQAELIMEAAKMAGNMGAAALNGIHAQASVSGNDSTVTSIEG